MSPEAGAPSPTRGKDASAWAFAALCLASGVALSLFFVWLCYFPSSDGLVRRAGRVAALAGGDYANMFVGAHLVLQGRAPDAFDLGAYMRAARSLTSPLLPFHNWSYPPTLFLFVWPLAFVPYGIGYLIWVLGGFSALLAAVLPALRRSQRRVCGLFLLLAPASIVNIADGQNGFFTAAFLLGGLRLVDSKPYLAGCLFGLLTLKPQMGLLVPLILIALRRWNVVVAACLTTVVMVGLSLLVFGAHVWVEFLGATSAYQLLVIESSRGFYRAMMVSVFVAVKEIGAGDLAATVAQGIAFAAAACACVFLVRRTSDFSARALAVSCAALLATPYAFNYDMAATAAASLVFVMRRGELPTAFILACASLWLTPTVVVYFNHWVPLGPIGLVLPLGVLVWDEYGRGRTPVADAAPVSA